jgi:hypothetical protein
VRHDPGRGAPDVSIGAGTSARAIGRSTSSDTHQEDHRHRPETGEETDGRLVRHPVLSLFDIPRTGREERPRWAVRRL